ncbi:Rieske (2Fe-2S) protein [Streptomyces sp. NPDC001515]
MSTARNPEAAVGRRKVVTAAGAVSVTALLTACGGAPQAAGPGSGAGAGSGSGAGAGAGAGSGAGTAALGRAGGTGNGSAIGTGDGTGSTVLAKTSEIPEGGGKVFDEQKVVVTQPAPGTFKAFSATCTHMGCTVADVSDGTINCPCHGSRFDMTTGGVANGPATEPLPPTAITVRDGAISLAP